MRNLIKMKTVFVIFLMAALSTNAFEYRPKKIDLNIDKEVKTLYQKQPKTLDIDLLDNNNVVENLQQTQSLIALVQSTNIDKLEIVRTHPLNNKETLYSTTNKTIIENFKNILRDGKPENLCYCQAVLEVELYNNDICITSIKIPDCDAIRIQTSQIKLSNPKLLTNWLSIIGYSKNGKKLTTQFQVE